MIPLTLSKMSGAVADLAPTIANHLWQSTLFAALAGALTLLLRTNQARLRYWMWMAVSVKFLIPFSLLVGVGSHLARPHGIAATHAAVYFAVQQVSEPFARQVAPVLSSSVASTNFMGAAGLLPGIAGTAWFAGFAFALGLWCLRWRRIAVAVGKAVPVREGRELVTLRRLEKLGGVRVPTEMRLMSASMEPGIFGVARPILVWPSGISERLNDAHLEAILAHEVCHIRRRDNLTAATHMLVEALFWFHPLVWWLGARLVEERERACDEEVLCLCKRPQVYAESILKVCEFCVESPLACVSGVTGADLKKRIVQIMTERVVRKVGVGRKALLAAAGFAAIAVPMMSGVVRLAPMYGQIVQAAGPLPTFEAATIKPSDPGALGKGFRIQGRHFGTLNTSVMDLIQYAYGVQERQIIGAPAWLDMGKYDVVAVAGESDSANPMWKPMVQRLLKERFELSFHPDSKELPVYELRVGKNGPKLTKSEANSDHNELSFGGAKSPSARSLHGKATTMPQLASLLQAALLDRPVVDRTGLSGQFDFEMTFAGGGKGSSDAPAANDDADASASIFTAIQEELGLKLEPAKGPVEVMVIDHIAKPSEN